MLVFSFSISRTPSFSVFPYTTLFRSHSARLSLAQELLNFGAGHFDGVEVRRIGGQIKHARIGRLHACTHAIWLVRIASIESKDLAGLEPRHQKLVQELQKHLPG